MAETQRVTGVNVLLLMGVTMSPIDGYAQLSIDLPCSSGFGDRLLDMWSMGTIAALRNETISVAVSGTHEYFSFRQDVDDAIRRVVVPGLNLRPDLLPPSSWGWDPLQERTKIQDDGQLYFSKMHRWGTYTPEEIFRDLDALELGDVTVNDIADAFRAVARGEDTLVHFLVRCLWRVGPPEKPIARR